MVSEIVSEILNDLGNYLLGSPFSAFIEGRLSTGDLVPDFVLAVRGQKKKRGRRGEGKGETLPPPRALAGNEIWQNTIAWARI